MPVCVHVCVRACMCVCMYSVYADTVIHRCTCMQRQEEDIGHFFLYNCQPYSLEIASLPDLEARHFTNFQDSPIFFHNNGITQNHVWILCDHWGSELRSLRLSSNLPCPLSHLCSTHFIFKVLFWTLIFNWLCSYLMYLVSCFFLCFLSFPLPSSTFLKPFFSLS